MDGACVAETGPLTHVVNRQSDGQLAAVVPNSQLTVSTDVVDGPTVAVFHPVGGAQPKPPVVAAGDDHISDTGPVPVGQRHLGYCSGVIEPMRAGTSVQSGDQVSGGGDHDRVEPSRPVGSPGAERVFGGSGEVANMHATMLEVELQRLKATVTEEE